LNFGEILSRLPRRKPFRRKAGRKLHTIGDAGKAQDTLDRIGMEKQCYAAETCEKLQALKKQDEGKARSHRN